MSKSPLDAIKPHSKQTDELAFTRKNYYILIVGFVLVIVGFLLMAGGGSQDPTVFNEAIFNTQRLTVAPILVMGGYAVVFFAIMKRFPAERQQEKKQN